MIFRVGLFLCTVFYRIFFNIEVTGKDSLPPKGTPFILASNHLSNLDPPLLGVLVAPLKLVYLAKEELFKNKVFGFILSAVGCVPLKRGSSDIRAVRTALKALKQKPVLIFPQGTRSQDYDNFTDGIGFLCKKSEVPVVAAKIEGTDKALPKGAKFVKRVKIRVSFALVKDIKGSDSYQEISAKVMETIRNL